MNARLLVNRDFTLLWTGGAISSVGSGTSLLAYPLLVLATTESPGLVGVTMAVAMVTRLLAGLPGGVAVDRVNKKMLLLMSDLLRAVVQGTLALAILTDSAAFPVILLLIAAESALGTVFSAAEPTAVRLVVNDDQLAVALARNEARSAAAMMLGPPLGGLLFGLAPWAPFAFDAASYLISFLLIALLRTPLPGQPGRQRMRAAPTGRRCRCFHRWRRRSVDAGTGPDAETGTASTPERLSLLRSIREGLCFLWKHSFIRTTLLLMAGNNLVSNAIMLVVIVLSQQAGDAELTTGLIMTIAGVGTLVGAVLAPSVVRLLSVRAILVLNRLCWMLLIALMAAVPNSYLLGLLIGLMFFLGPAGSSAVTALQMRLTPDELQGRARSTAGTMVGVAAPVGTAVVGLALEHITPEATVLVLALWMGLMAMIALSSRPVRREGTVRVGAPSET